MLLALPLSAAARVLIVYGDEQLPPYEFMEDGQPKGINVDLWQAIGKKLGRPVEFRLMDWPRAQAEFREGKGDALTILGRTPEREAIYDFSQSLYPFSFNFFVRTGDSASFTDFPLARRRIGVTAGGLPRRYFEQHSPDIPLFLAPDTAEGIRRVLRGDIDAFVANTWTGEYVLRNLGIRGVIPLPTPAFSVEGAIALRRGDPSLVDINLALTELKKDGTIDRILDRWSGQKVVMFSEEEIRTLARNGLVATLVVVLFLLLLQARRRQRELSEAVGKATGLLEERTAALEAANRALQDSESSLRQLIATLPGTVWTATEAGEVNFISNAWYVYTGTTSESQLDWGWIDAIHPEDREGTLQAWHNALTLRRRFHAEYRLRRNDGTYRWFKSRGTPILGPDGTVSRWLGVLADIHDLKTSQEALAASRAELLEAQRLGRMGNWFWDAVTGETMGTAELLRLLGRTTVPKFAEQRGTVFSEEDWQRIRSANLQCVLHGVSYHMELQACRADGRTIWLAVRGERVPTPGHRYYSLRGTAQDITERKEAELEVERLNADLENRVRERTAELMAVNRELEGFTFATSHDLKGPLGRISSFSRLLEKNYRDRLDGDGLIFLDFISQNALRLSHLVDDLLSHARVAQQNLEPQPVSVGDLVRVVLQEKGDDIRDAGADVRLALEPGSVMGDFHALHQALGNLVENALKYSAQSSPPTVEIGGVRMGENYRLWVRDNGIGFDMVYHDRIFEIFRRLHTYSEYEGTGVGLALVKRAMERQGGKVWAESQPGRGATFFLELPAADVLESADATPR
ncbi:MAG: transporter substrate-binding domain-containing protein [Actinomycetota bacterium]